MTDCDLMPSGQMDQGQPNLCKAHCEMGQQSLDSKNLADIPAASVDVLRALIWMLTPIQESADLPFVTRYASGRPPGTLALFLVNQVFRL